MIRYIVIAIGGGIVGGGAVWLFQGHSLNFVPGEMQYADLAAILLTGAGLFLAAIGIFLAVGALWGYAHFKNIVKEAAETTALTKMDEELVDGDLRRRIELIVTQLIQRPEFLDLLEERRRREEQAREIDEEGWEEVQKGEGRE